MQFVLLLSFLAVVCAKHLRRLDVEGNTSVSLVWVASDSPSTTWVAATCDRNTGKNIVGSNSKFNTYISKDFGLTFSATVSPNLGFYDFTSDGTGQYIAAGTQTSGIYISRDFGTTWSLSNCPASGDFYALGSSLKVGTNGTAWTIVAVSLSSDVYISRNSGFTWSIISPVTHTTGASYGSGIGVNTHGEVIQVTYTDPTKGTTFYYSSNYGSTWTATTPSVTLGPISASLETGQYLVAGGTGAIYVSSNYGASWTAATVPDSSLTYTYSAVSGSGQYAAIVGGSQIYFSSDFGQTWTLTNAPAKTYVQLSTDLLGDRWVTAASGGKVIVGKLVRK